MDTLLQEKRFHRTQLLLGEKKLSLLKNSFVVIVGLGAVGGYALEAIARSGVQQIRVVDFDTIEESNINRQILATNETIGRYKSQLALERIKSINPFSNVDKLDLFLDASTIDAVLAPAFGFKKPSLVIDAIDCVSSKILLLKESIKREIPIFSSMGAALRTQTDRIKTADLMQTHGCGLAKEIRKAIRKELNLSSESDQPCGIITVYSDEPIPKEGKSMLQKNAANSSEEKALGSLVTIPAIFGMTLANCAIQFLTTLHQEEQ